MEPASGIETIADFLYGLDHLTIDLAGAANSTLQAFDTTVDGNAAIAITSNDNNSHGVVLLGMGTQTASDLLANHVTFGNGQAVIN